MIPQHLASNEALHPIAQSHSGNFIDPGVRHSSLSYDATINPALLMGDGNHEPLSQYNLPSTSLYIPGGSHYRRPSPAQSTSAEVWMGYLGHRNLASVPSPISPTISIGDGIYAMPLEHCICGCDRGACIPQREYDRQRTDTISHTDLQETIPFSVNGRCGYPLADALKKRYTGLDGRDDKMFTTFRSSISIRLEWLPYERWTKQIRTLTWKKNPERITRAKLATEVAKRMKLFFEEMKNKAVDPSYLKYRVQPGVIDLDHLELVALKRVAKSSYMPHFRLISPSQSL